MIHDEVYKKYAGCPGNVKPMRCPVVGQFENF